MNNKLINVVEAMTQMSESLLRLMYAIRKAKLAIDNVLRMQYKAAGFPFGESEEGLILWRAKLARDYALFHEKAVPSGFPWNVFGENYIESRDVPANFSSLNEEVQRRIN